MNIKQTITNYLSIFGLSQNPPTKTELESNVWFLAKIPMDINEHLVKMMDTIVQKNAKVVVELGCRGGVSSQAFIAGVAKAGGFVTSYDIHPLKKVDGPRNTTLIERLGSPTRVKDYWRFKIGSSLEVHEEWEDGSIDVLFIDTDHTKEQIYNELNLWGKKVKPDGLIMVHDVTLENVTLRQGLMEFLAENDKYVYEEDPHNCGMGFLTRNLAL